MVQPPQLRIVALLSMLIVLQPACASDTTEAAPPAIGGRVPLTVPEPKAAREKHLVAVVADNAGTEITDFVVPYGVLAASGAANVVPVSAEPGPVNLFPALKLHLDRTLADFDAQHPQGADIVVVPAMHQVDDDIIIRWLQRQWQSGALLVGVCDGVLTLAQAGLLEGRRATGHWYSMSKLRREHPDTTWVPDRRYVADGPVVTTTGVTASIPVSLALVEAIGGRSVATRTAAELGVTDYQPDHDSDAFGLSGRLVSTALGNLTRFWGHETVGLEVHDGIDEIALALTADAWSRTYRSQAVALHPDQATVRSKRGLAIGIDGSRVAADHSPNVVSRHPARALDRALAEMAERYGRPTAEFVAMQLEYELTPAR